MSSLRSSGTCPRLRDLNSPAPKPPRRWLFASKMGATHIQSVALALLLVWCLPSSAVAGRAQRHLARCEKELGSSCGTPTAQGLDLTRLSFVYHYSSWADADASVSVPVIDAGVAESSSEGTQTTLAEVRWLVGQGVASWRSSHVMRRMFDLRRPRSSYRSLLGPTVPRPTVPRTSPLWRPSKARASRTRAPASTTSRPRCV